MTAVGDTEPVEPGDAGDEHAVPPDLVELHEVLEWEAARRQAEERQ